MIAKTTRIIVAATVIVVLFFVFSKMALSAELLHEYYFFQDYSAYWSGFQVMKNGQNPYNPSNIEFFLHKAGLLSNGPIYPAPFIFLIFAPLFQMDFAYSASAWAIINLASTLVILEMTKQLYCKSENEVGLGAAFIILTFFPFYFAFKMGQFSIFVTFCALLSCLLYSRNKKILSGFIFSLTIIKPHLSWVLGIAYLIDSLKSRDLKFILGLTFSLTIQTAAIMAVFPHIFENWLNMQSSPFIWRGYSLSSELRFLLLEHLSSTGHTIIILIFPVLALLWVLYASLYSRSGERFLSIAPSCLAAGALAAPYFWFADGLILFPSYIILWHICLSKEAGWRCLTSRVLISFLVITSLISIYTDGLTYLMSWYIIILAISSILIIPKSTKLSSTSPTLCD